MTLALGSEALIAGQQTEQTPPKRVCVLNASPVSVLPYMTKITWQMRYQEC